MPEDAVQQPLDDYFICSICMMVVSCEMVECGQCSKLNCKTCISDWTRKHSDCPNCRCEYKAKENPNLYVMNLLRDFKFQCTRCKEPFAYRKQLKHINECSGRRL